MVAAYAQLRLARESVADLRLPWERPYDKGRLTPVRVHRVVSSLLVELGTPAKAPKPCERSPGRPKGSFIPGSPAYVSKATKYRRNTSDYGLKDIDLEGHNAIQGHFKFEAA